MGRRAPCSLTCPSSPSALSRPDSRAAGLTASSSVSSLACGELERGGEGRDRRARARTLPACQRLRRLGARPTLPRPTTTDPFALPPPSRQPDPYPFPCPPPPPPCPTPRRSSTRPSPRRPARSGRSRPRPSGPTSRSASRARSQTATSPRASRRSTSVRPGCLSSLLPVLPWCRPGLGRRRRSRGLTAGVPPHLPPPAAVPVIALAPSASLTATKISFLLHLDRYDTALALLVSLAPEARRELAFEHAYGLYRLGREAEARKVLDQAAGAGEGAEFLQAQLVRPFPLPPCSRGWLAWLAASCQGCVLTCAVDGLSLARRTGRTSTSRRPSSTRPSCRSTLPSVPPLLPSSPLDSPTNPNVSHASHRITRPTPTSSRTTRSPPRGPSSHERATSTRSTRQGSTSSTPTRSRMRSRSSRRRRRRRLTLLLARRGSRQRRSRLPARGRSARMRCQRAPSTARRSPRTCVPLSTSPCFPAGPSSAQIITDGRLRPRPALQPDRWLPLKARASNPKSANFNPNYTSGTSMSNIASSGGAPPPAAKKKAGGGKKKGKK